MRDDVDVPSRHVPRRPPRARSTPEVSFRSAASFVSFASAMFAGARRGVRAATFKESRLKSSTLQLGTQRRLIDCDYTRARDEKRRIKRGMET